jgi:hypothetical protein
VATIAPYIFSVANRPCKPDGDLKKLWQTLMPGVAMPACGIAGDDAARDREDEAPPDREQDQATSPLKRAR